MNILLKTIESLSKEEIRYYKIFSNRTHNEKNRKDLALFEEIKNSTKDYNEKEIAEKMYRNKKNNFYQSQFLILVYYIYQNIFFDIHQCY